MFLALLNHQVSARLSGVKGGLDSAVTLLVKSFSIKVGSYDLLDRVATV